MKNTVKNEIEDSEYVISDALAHLGLDSHKKFVCLEVFNPEEKHTLAEWHKLMVTKKVI